MLFRKIAVTFLSIFFVHAAIADDNKDAIFGLKWGMMISEIRGLGISLNKEKRDRNLEIYSTPSLPRQLSDAEKYFLTFSDGKLVKVSAIGKKILNDPSGREGKERFSVLKNSLGEKYGPPSFSYESTGNKLYKEYDEFYQCMAYDGCGMWAAAFDAPGKMVAVELNGLSRGTGFIKVIAEAVPEWNNALDKMKSFKNQSDSDAL